MTCMSVRKARRLSGVLLVVCTLVMPAPLTAGHFQMLTLPGKYRPPSIVGLFPIDSAFSWWNVALQEGIDGFSWIFGGGIDGGILFGQGQNYGEMTDVFITFNQPTALFSANDGILIAEDSTIDMTNLRFLSGSGVKDIGNVPGYSSLVPLVPDIATLGPGVNGWSYDSNGIYHLVYHSKSCDSCWVAAHFYGYVIPTDPAAFQANGDIN